ncbi:MAG TPA: hypothetical protein PKE45_24275, partial [Caldilineaceae bacterium]|nr:hypothetical protein [Caldilineaceae bacterium]
VGLEWRRERKQTIDNGPSTINHRGGPLGALIAGFVVWGALATLTFVLLWPAMWVDPLGTLLRMGNEMGEYVERHTTLNYFWGQPVNDPGP